MKKSGTIAVPPKTSANAMFMQFCDCRTVTFEKKFDSEDMLTGTLSLEFSGTDDSGYANYFTYFTNSTATALKMITTNMATEHRGAFRWSTTAVTYTAAYST
jgi:hypothetical protein